MLKHPNVLWTSPAYRKTQQHFVFPCASSSSCRELYHVSRGPKFYHAERSLPPLLLCEPSKEVFVVFFLVVGVLRRQNKHFHIIIIRTRPSYLSLESWTLQLFRLDSRVDRSSCLHFFYQLKWQRILQTTWINSSCLRRSLRDQIQSGLKSVEVAAKERRTWN